MQCSAWIELLRRLPADLHDSLSLGIVTGSEIVVQQLIKLESDFMVIRGRMAGSTAEGRVMLVPYSHLVLVAVNKPMMEPDVQALLGGAAPADSAMVAPSPAPPAPNGTPLPAPVEPPLTGAEPAAHPPKIPVSKSVLLARLRDRLKEKAGHQRGAT